MFIISFILAIKATILNSIPNQPEFSLKNIDSSCQKVDIVDKINYYIEIQEDANVIQKTANNVADLFNEKWNQNFIQQIYEEIFLPQNFLILQTQKIEFKEKTYLCFLLQDQNIQSYQIYCTNEINQQFVDNQIKYTILYEFSFLIPKEEDQNCQGFAYLIEKFYIFCHNNSQIIFITLDMVGNKSFQHIDISFSSCKIMFKNMLNSFFVVSLYQCQDWEIIIFNIGIKIIERLTNSNLLNEIHEISSYQYLQDVKFCYQSLLLDFQSNYIQIKLKNETENIIYENIKLDENIKQQFYINCILITKFHIQTQLGNFIASVSKFDDLKEIFVIDKMAILLQFSNHFIIIITNKNSETIKIEINQLVPLTDNTQFLIVSPSNKISLFKLNLFQVYYSFQQNQNFVAFYSIQSFFLKFIKCYEFIQNLNENIRQNNLFRQIKNSNYVVQIDDQFDFSLQIDKLSFLLEKDINLDFSFSMISKQNDVQLGSKEQCKIFSKNLSHFGQFYFFNVGRRKYVIYNDKDFLIHICDCNLATSFKYNLNLNLNMASKYYQVLSKNRLIFIQDNIGKIIIFEQEKYYEAKFKYKIYQFKDQIKVSCIYKNYLIFQLQNSQDIYYEFNNQIYKNNISNYLIQSLRLNFKQNFQKNILNLINNQEVFIFQYESYILIQQPTKFSQIISQQLIVLGSYLISVQPFQSILIGIDQNTNTLYKYLITYQNFYLISTFTFTDYFPIQPLQYQIQSNNFVIVTQKQEKSQFYILVFNLKKQNSFDYYNVIETTIKYIVVNQHVLYYYYNQELREFNLKYYIINFPKQNFEQIIQNQKLKIVIHNTSVQNYSQSQYEIINVAIINIQYKLILVNHNNSQIIIKNDQSIFYPRKFVQGQFDEIELLNNTVFELQNIFKVINRIQCHQFTGSICIINNQSFLQFQDLSNNNENYIPQLQNTGGQIFIFLYNYSYILVEQLDEQNIRIIHINNDQKNFVFLVGQLISVQSKQQLLKIQTNQLINYYFINDKINLIFSQGHNSIFQNNFLFYQITYNQFCYATYEKTEIYIYCIQIVQGIIQSLKNHTILIRNIYESVQFNQYLINFLDSIKIETLNISLISENNLDFRFFLYYKSELMFYYQIIFDKDEYLIKLNNIIRHPLYDQKAQSYLLQDKILIYYPYSTIYLYDLQDGFQILSPDAILFIPKQKLEFINNTNIFLYDREIYEVKIIEIDKWRIIKKPNVSLNNREFLIFYMINKINSLQFQVDILIDQNNKTFQNLIITLIVVINNILVILIISIKKQKKK